MYAMSYVLDRLELIDLQKIFYILSNFLLVIGIWQVLARKRKSKKVEQLLRIERTNNLVQFVSNPEHKGEIVLKTFNILKIGGKKMKEFIKSLGRLQWASLVLTIVILILGVLSSFVPELEPIAENILYFFGAIGIVAIPGVLSHGKKIGDVAKNVLPKKDVRLITKTIKTYQRKAEQLAKQYEPIIKLALDVKELGGRLTSDQQTQYDTYLAQEKALQAKIETEKLKLEVADETL